MVKLTSATVVLVFFTLIRPRALEEQVTTISVSENEPTTRNSDEEFQTATHPTVAGDEREREEDEDSSGIADMTFDEIEKSVQHVVRRILKMTFPYMLRMGTETKTSTLCMLSLTRMYFAIPKLQEWAFRMLDASGKVSGGLLEGTSMALGDYDECLDVVIGGGPLTTDSDTGAYCLVETRPSPSLLAALKEFQVEKHNRTELPLGKTKTFLGFLRNVKSNPNHMTFRLGLCMPSTCSKSDVQNILDIITREVPVPAKVISCESNTSLQVEIHQWIILVIISIFLMLAAVGTVLDCVITNYDIEYKNQFSDSKMSSKPKTQASLSVKVSRVLLQFSVYRSTARLLDCRSEGDALDPMRGLKVITVVLTIFTHTYALPHPLHMFRYRNALNFFKFIDKILFAAVANSSVGVETFFFIAGFLLIYNRWRHSGKSSAASYIVKFVSAQYVRIILAEALVVCLFLLFPLLGSGPLWHAFLDGPLENCQKKWWMNLFFIQNFLGPYDSCLYHTWILAAIMQITIVMASVVWVMSRWPSFGIISNVVVIVMAMTAVAVVTAVTGYPATLAVYFYDYRTSLYVWKYLYVQAYNHIAPFCIGMLTGYYTAEHSSSKISKPVVMFCWVGSAVTCIMIVFGLHNYRDGQEMNRGLAVFYAAMHRPAWAAALGWILYSCATGYGGSVQSVLSWKAFAPLERLCYFAWLIHIPLMYYHGAVQRERIFMGHYNQVMSFVSYAVVSFFLSFICYIFFQAPYEALEAFLFGKRPGNLWQPEDIQDHEKDVQNKSSSLEKNNSEASGETFVDVDIASESTRTHM